jgi:hypothetical protein
MEHTEVVPRVQRENAYEHVDQVTTGGSTDAALEQSHIADPPDPDMNPLIYQLYARIKRELLIERERKGGLS